MGGFFSGLAGSLGDKLHEMHVENLNSQINSQRNALDAYKVLSTDPNMEDVHGDIVGAMLKLASLDPSKAHKLLNKPNSELSPAAWQQEAHKRATGQSPSPMNRGQNPSMIPAAPMQHDGTPGGGAAMAPPWNNAGGGSSVDPYGPGGQWAGWEPGGFTGASNPDGTPHNGLGRQQPQMPTSMPPSQTASAVSGMGAQSVQGLPPAPGSPEPSGVEVVSPQAAQATSATPMPAPTMIPPPPVADIYQGNGSLTYQERERRNLKKFSDQKQAENRAEAERQIQVQEAEGKRQIAVDKSKRQSQIAAAMEGAKQAGIQFDPNDPQSYAKAMQNASPIQQRMAEFFAGQSPKISRDLVTMAPGGAVYDPNTGEMKLNPQLPPAMMDRQIAFDTLAQQIGKPSAALTAEEKQIAEFIGNPKGATGPDIARKYSEFVAANKRIPTATERTKIEAAEEQRLKNITNPVQRITIQNQGMMQDKSAVDIAAQNALQTGDYPVPNGRNAPFAIRVLQRVGELAKEQGIPVDQVKLQGMATKAKAAALRQIEVQSAGVEAFENTAKKNLDLALEQSNKTDRTGSPLVNRYLQAVQSNVFGDEDVRLLHNYVVTAANEYAKVVSGANAGRAVTDSARREAEDMLNKSFKKGEFKTAVEGMKKEMQNRLTSFNDEKQQLRQGMGAKGASTIIAPPPGASSSAVQSLIDKYK